MLSVQQEHKSFCYFYKLCRKVKDTLQHFDAYVIRISETEGDQNEITTGSLSEEGKLIMCEMD
jgi:hypothetical protein